MIGGFIRERVTPCGSLKTSLHILWPFLYNKKVDGFVVFSLDGLVMTLTGACSGSDAVRLLRPHRKGYSLPLPMGTLV